MLHKLKPVQGASHKVKRKTYSAGTYADGCSLKGVCARRCRDAHVSFYAEHEYLTHEPGERASKRSKVIDVELNLLHAEIE